ncbi:c-type cytochrome [Chryseobacterium sp. CT-SW4]|uniref:c-type cytochrome n=1 Tax=Chryseobacterium sp. SW-1 TaxID=3157343 RepID=UPI003B02C69D
MKKIVLTTALLSVVLTACSGKKEAEAVSAAAETNIMLEEPKPVDSSAIASAAASPEEEGLKLIEGTDCLACHKVDERLVGPSYQEVADKYTDADADLLAQKIIEGGQGVWGEVPMAPHTGMSKDNAKLMVKYILSLKKG